MTAVFLIPEQKNCSAQSFFSFLLHLDGSIGEKCEYKWLSIAHIFRSNIWQSMGWDKGLLVLNYRNLKEKNICNSCYARMPGA